MDVKERIPREFPDLYPEPEVDVGSVYGPMLLDVVSSGEQEELGFLIPEITEEGPIL